MTPSSLVLKKLLALLLKLIFLHHNSQTPSTSCFVQVLSMVLYRHFSFVEVHLLVCELLGLKRREGGGNFLGSESTNTSWVALSRHTRSDPISEVVSGKARTKSARTDKMGLGHSLHLSWKPVALFQR